MGFKIRRTATGTATAIVYFCSDFRWLSTLTSGNKPNSWHGIARNLVDDHFPVRPHAVNSDCLPPRMSAFASRIANGFWTHRTDVRRCTYIMQNQLPWFIPIDYLLLFVNWCESRRISYSVRENRSILFFFLLAVRFLGKCLRAFVIMWTTNSFDGWCTQRSGKPFSCFRTKTRRHLFYGFRVRKVVSTANRKSMRPPLTLKRFFSAARKHFLFFFRLYYWWGALSAVCYNIADDGDFVMLGVVEHVLPMVAMGICASTNSLSFISTS